MTHESRQNLTSDELETYLVGLKCRTVSCDKMLCNKEGEEEEGEDFLIHFPDQFDEIVECMSRHDIVRQSEIEGSDRKTWSSYALSEGFGVAKLKDDETEQKDSVVLTDEELSYEGNSEKLENEILRMEALDRKLRKKEMIVLNQLIENETALDSLRKEVETGISKYEEFYGAPPPKVLLPSTVQSQSLELVRMKEDTSHPLAYNQLLTISESSSLSHGDVGDSTQSIFRAAENQNVSEGTAENQNVSEGTYIHNATYAESVLDDSGCNSANFSSEYSFKSSKSIQENNAHVKRNKLMAARFGQCSLTEQEEETLEKVLSRVGSGECFGGEIQSKMQQEINKQLFSRGYWFENDQDFPEQDHEIHQGRPTLKQNKANRIFSRRSELIVALEAARLQQDQGNQVNQALKYLAEPLNATKMQNDIRTEEIELGRWNEFSIDDLIEECQQEIAENGVQIASYAEISELLARIREINGANESNTFQANTTY